MYRTLIATVALVTLPVALAFGEHHPGKCDYIDGICDNCSEDGWDCYIIPVCALEYLERVDCSSCTGIEGVGDEETGEEWVQGCCSSDPDLLCD